MNAKPNAQNSNPQSAVSTMHSSRMLEVSRVRAKPASSIMKPACMKKTRNAVTNTQMVFTGLTMSDAVTSYASAAKALDESHGAIAQTAASSATTPSIFPRKYTKK